MIELVMDRPGWAFEGSGFEKSQARPGLWAQAGPGSGLGLGPGFWV